jgi:membrane-bound lytic murein transglycosylase D
MKHFLLFAILTISFISKGFSSKQNEDSTIVNDVKQDSYNFEDNLDSLLHLYYVHNSPVAAEELLNDSTSENAVVYIPDSVYISRLRKIPTAVKLTYNPIVRQYIEMYTQRKRDRVQIMLGMAEYYFPVFDDIFDSYGIPVELKYMSIIESALNPRARSRTRAIGLWQFMYGTGKRYDLTINSFVDERCDPFKATDAAARYVKDLYDIYQDWQLVVAAYNCGPGNVNKAIRRAGGKRDYWEIYRYLPRETRGHVPAFIAAIYTMNFYKEHNLTPAPITVPLHIDTIMVRHQLHLQQVAEVLKVPIEQLRDMNPQYIRNIIPATNGQAYPLTIPLALTSKFIDLEDSIYAYKDSIFFNPKELLKTPDLYSKKSRYVPSGKNGKVIYTVEEGDNIGYIAQRYKVNINDLKDWNGLDNNIIRIGQKLVIYTSGKVTKQQAEVDSSPTQSKSTTIAQNQVKKKGDAIANNVIFYTVKNGDTLWDIAKKFPGTSQTDLKKWNNLSNSEKIVPGQVLKIVKL